MLTKQKCWGLSCATETLSLVNQMRTDWHDSAHLMGLEDLEHIVPCHISEDQICRFRPRVLVKNVDPNVCTTSCRKWCKGRFCSSINSTKAPLLDAVPVVICQSLCDVH